MNEFALDNIWSNNFDSEAFKDIKTATGVTDVQDLVKKFLTRESTYS